MLKPLQMTVLAAVSVAGLMMLSGCVGSKLPRSEAIRTCPALPLSLIEGWALPGPLQPIQQDFREQSPEALLQRKLALSSAYRIAIARHNEVVALPRKVDQAYRDLISKHPASCGGQGPELDLEGGAL